MNVRALGLLGVVAFVAILGLILFAGPSAGSAANDFMHALQAGDVDRLTELSYVPKEDGQKIRKQWEFCIHTATPYYNFLWHPSFVRQISDDEVVVKMKVVKNAENSSSYDEDYDLCMVKVDNKWKVDVYRLNGKFYPALPKPSSDF